ncbi:hypothetical protein [Winogradskyella luteola]|uniref:Uncharacterized protein n=1 Tax=Winogradskyella luteola TaxID=2828330 RepID=A0A9X1F9F8_9FLAO|nr:hypothetical protein [Winogradskyella luteola]MBV7268400.1 hypothetical protein [Winogradskyella luteola]
MCVQIQQPNERQILVNEKLVQKDIDGNWIAKIELTTTEYEAFNKHVKALSREDATNNKKP